MIRKPKAIFFDLDETLVENQIPVPELFARMYFDFSEQLGRENRELFFATLRVCAGELWNTMFEIDIAPEKQFVMCFEKSIAATEAVSPEHTKILAQTMFDHYVDLSSNNVVFHDGAIETLAELSARGYITGLITNGIEQVQLGKIHRLDLHNKVDHVTVSAQARAHKPHQPVFDLALQRAGVGPNEAWQIGDHATNDVAGAIRAGMSGVFYDPAGERRQHAFAELAEDPTHTIGHLSEILSLAEDSAR